MEPNNHHIYREKNEAKRLMENFDVKPPARTLAKIERMLEGQREHFRKIEQERTRGRSRGRGR